MDGGARSWGGCAGRTRNAIVQNDRYLPTGFGAFRASLYPSIGVLMNLEEYATVTFASIFTDIAGLQSPRPSQSQKRSWEKL